MKERDHSDTLSEEDENSELVTCSKETDKVKKYQSFTQKYNPQYLKYWFVSVGDIINPEPMCVICGVTLSNNAMKPSKLICHPHSIQTAYKDKWDLCLVYFSNLYLFDLCNFDVLFLEGVSMRNTVDTQS